MRPNQKRVTFAAAILAVAVSFAMTPGAAQATPSPVPAMTPLTVTLGTIPSQTFIAPAGAVNPVVTRDSYTVTVPAPKRRPTPAPVTAVTPTATPAAGGQSVQASLPAPVPAVPQAANWSTDPGSAEGYALSQLPTYGWGQDQFSCLVQLWTRESGWNAAADNTSSGAYGIPQALPGSKMASAGADWQTNPDTQIRWGLGYIQRSYGAPCQAWAHETSAGWY